MNIPAILARTPLFKGFSDEVLEDIAKQCRVKEFPKDAELFSLGDKAKHFYIVMTGWVKIYRLSREGNETIVHIFGPHESFAEAAVFNLRPHYPVNAQAVDKATVLEIPSQYFIHKIKQDSSFALHMLATISARQHYLVQQLEQIAGRNASQRLGTFLLKFSQQNPAGIESVTLPYDKSLIALRINIKPETFSRALSKLQPYITKHDNRTIHIHNKTALATYCDILDV